jgi:hypothetical protein
MDIDEARRAGGVLGKLRSMGLHVQIAAQMVGLFLLPAKRNSIPEKTRLAPAW